MIEFAQEPTLDYVRAPDGSLALRGVCLRSCADPNPFPRFRLWSLHRRRH